MNVKTARIILDIKDNEELTEELIKRKYRNKALKCHPDKNKSAGAKDQFIDVKNAYEFLSKHRGIEYKVNSYSELLYDFIKDTTKGINGGMNISANLFNIIIEKLSHKCEEKIIKILENIDKGTLYEIYHIITQNNGLFDYIDNDMIEKLKNIIGDRSRNDEVIILNPTIDDLLEFNVYKCCIHGQQLIIPLWNSELVYDISCSDIYIKCNPVLHDNHFIDEYNNIHVKVELTIADIWNKTIHKVNVGKKVFELNIEELKMMKYQSLTLKNRGIPRINRTQIYDVSVLGDVVTHIHIEQ
jgi:DnaJ-class molecular chaperone